MLLGEKDSLNTTLKGLAIGVKSKVNVSLADLLPVEIGSGTSWMSDVIVEAGAVISVSTSGFTMAEGVGFLSAGNTISDGLSFKGTISVQPGKLKELIESFFRGYVPTSLPVDSRIPYASFFSSSSRRSNVQDEFNHVATKASEMITTIKGMGLEDGIAFAEKEGLNTGKLAEVAFTVQSVAALDFVQLDTTLAVPQPGGPPNTTLPIKLTGSVTKNNATGAWDVTSTGELQSPWMSPFNTTWIDITTLSANVAFSCKVNLTDPTFSASLNSLSMAASAVLHVGGVTSNVSINFNRPKEAVWTATAGLAGSLNLGELYTAQVNPTGDSSQPPACLNDVTVSDLALIVHTGDCGSDATNDTACFEGVQLDGSLLLGATNVAAKALNGFGESRSFSMAFKFKMPFSDASVGTQGEASVLELTSVSPFAPVTGVTINGFDLKATMAGTGPDRDGTFTLSTMMDLKTGSSTLTLSIAANYTNEKWQLSGSLTAPWNKAFGFDWWTVTTASVSAQFVSGNIQNFQLQASTALNFNSTDCDTTIDVEFAAAPKAGESLLDSATYSIDMTTSSSCLAMMAASLLSLSDDSTASLKDLAGNVPIRFVLTKTDKMIGGVAFDKGITLTSTVMSQPDSVATAMLRGLNPSAAGNTSFTLLLTYDPYLAEGGRRGLPFTDNAWVVQRGVKVDPTRSIWTEPWDGSQASSWYCQGISITSCQRTHNLVQQQSSAFLSVSSSLVTPLSTTQLSLRRSTTPTAYFSLSVNGFDINDKWRCEDLRLTVSLSAVSSLTFSANFRLELEGSDPVYFIVAAQASFPALSFTIAGGMLGTWRNLFGYQGLDVSDASMSLTVGGTQGTILGGAASIQIGYTIVSFEVYVPIETPALGVFYTVITNFNLADFARFYNMNSNNKVSDSIVTTLESITLEHLELYVASRTMTVLTPVIENGVAVFREKKFEPGFSFDISATLWRTSIALSCRTETDGAEINGIKVPGFSFSLSLQNVPTLASIYLQVTEEIIETLMPNLDEGVKDILN